MTASTTTKALLALMRLKGMGRRGALKYLSTCPGVEENGLDALLAGVGPARINEVDLRTAWTEAEEQIEHAAAADIRAFAISDAGYPARLRRIPDPPAVLFIKGDAAGLHAANALAVVGTREPTTFGVQVARRSASTASSRGFAIVSGLAHGCDTFGHEGCLDGNGIGVAVMAHGLDRVYPAANRGLATRLLDNGGCLVSEYPIGVTPMRTAFAERDRIQSGLSDGVFVVETDVKGGTMHTVRFARDQGRPLGCVAHPTKWLGEDKTKGNQMLIADRWATPIPDSGALERFLDTLATAEKDAEPSHLSSRPTRSDGQGALAF